MSSALIPTPLEIRDFSGGMTDNVIGQADLTKFHKGENLDITDDNKVKTRPGCVFDSALPVNAPIRTLIPFSGEILRQSGRNLYRASGAAIVGPSSGNEAITHGDLTIHCSHAEWNNHLYVTSVYPGRPMKVFKDGADIKVLNLGLPKYSGTPVLSGAGSSGGDKSHAYACHYESTYTANGVTHTERSAVHFFGESTVYKAIGVSNPVNIAFSASLPVNSIDNYDATTKIVFYRNTNAGNTWYRIGHVLHLATSFVDTTPDSNLVLGEVLYTDGGTLDHDMPPDCRYLHQVNDLMVFGAVVENGVVKENKARLSNRFMPWSAPGSFEEEFEDDIIAVSSVGSYPIILCKRSIYRLEGWYDQKGQGTVRKKKIADTVGCLSDRSVIKTLNGIFFAGTNGFYYCDGFSVVSISEDINTTYNEIIKANKVSNIVGTFDGLRRRVLWAVTTGDGYNENNEIFIGHLNKAKMPHVPFTTWTGTFAGDHFQPISILSKDGDLYRSDDQGFVVVHKPGLRADVAPVWGEIEGNWETRPIIYNFQTIAYDFGSATQRKWVYQLIINANNEGNLHTRILSRNDNAFDGEERELKALEYIGGFEWGNPFLEWGADVEIDAYDIITAKRRFPKGGLRCSYKQLRFTNGPSVLDDFVVSGKATLNDSAKTLKVNDPVFLWSPQVVGQEIGLDNSDTDLPGDDYVEFDRYKVSALNPLTQEITIDTENKLLPSGPLNGNRRWRLYGLPADEVFSLISFSILYSLTTPTQDVFRGET